MGIPGERHKAAPDRQEAPSAAASLHPERRGQRGPAGGRTRPRPRGTQAGHLPAPGPRPRARLGPPLVAPSLPPSGCPAGFSFPLLPRRTAPGRAARAPSPQPPALPRARRRPRPRPGGAGCKSPAPAAPPSCPPLTQRQRPPRLLPPRPDSGAGPAAAAAASVLRRGNGKGNRHKTRQKQRPRKAGCGRVARSQAVWPGWHHRGP